MTIAAAFVCVDGIVLAADSEYTYNYSKYEGEKLFQFGSNNWAIGIAIAGTMDLAKMFVDELHYKLKKESDDLESLRDQIVALAKYFKEEYISKTTELEPARQLLAFVAIQMKASDKNLLLKVNGDVVSPVYSSDFIGAGDEIARATASWIFHPQLPRNVATQVALNILYWTAQHAQYCGQSIYALSIPKPWKLIPSFTFYQIKDFFFGLNELLRPILVGCLDVRVTEDVFEISLQALVDKMRLVRRDAMRAAAPFPTHLVPTAPSSPTEPEQQP
jgi:ATP-dependent protease HslVU (ClpYQ) peptidase subunit